MNPCEKNCSCERCKSCNVPLSGVIKAVDICNIQPVPVVPPPPTPIVENFIFNIQEEQLETDFFTLTLPPITLTGNQKVLLEVSSQVGAITTSGPSFYIEDIRLLLRRNTLPFNVGSSIFRQMVKVNPAFNQNFDTVITLLYVDNPGPGMYTYSVDVQNASQNVMDSFIFSTVITATIYNV